MRRKCYQLNCPAPKGLCVDRADSEYSQCKYFVMAKPGLELDKLTAEKVLGWHHQDSDIGGPRAWWFKEGKKEALHLNHFSTDIKAAWDLVEMFQLCVVPLGDQWTATRIGQILADGETNKAPTAPHAICLAALFYASEGEINV